MPVVMKMSENGMVDPKNKTIRLPGYLEPLPTNRGKLLRRAAIAAAPLFFLTVSSMPAHAASYVLTDGGGATATINTQASPLPGLTSLIVDSTQNVVQQWFYYRTSSSGGATSLESGTTEGTATYTGPTLETSYNGSAVNTNGKTVDFNVDLLYALASETNGVSLLETVTVTNTTTVPNGGNPSSYNLTMDLFQYNHFILDDNNTNDQVVISGGNTADQTLNSGPAVTLDVPVTSGAMPPNAFDTGTPTAILNEITNTGVLLNNTTAGPGDVAFAFEFDSALTPGQSASSQIKISEPATLSNVPEPAMVMGWLGAAGAWLTRRPRRKENRV